MANSPESPTSVASLHSINEIAIGSLSPIKTRNGNYLDAASNEELFSLYDVSIASSNRSAVRKVRDDRRSGEKGTQDESKPGAATRKDSSSISSSHSPRSKLASRGTEGGLSSLASWDSPSLVESSATNSISKSNPCGSDHLDDPNFAPPPILNILEGKLAANRLNDNVGFDDVPLYDKIRHSGHIMTRFSVSELLTKKW